MTSVTLLFKDGTQRTATDMDRPAELVERILTGQPVTLYGAYNGAVATYDAADILTITVHLTDVTVPAGYVCPGVHDGAGRDPRITVEHDGRCCDRFENLGYAEKRRTGIRLPHAGPRTPFSPELIAVIRATLKAAGTYRGFPGMTSGALADRVCRARPDLYGTRSTEDFVAGLDALVARGILIRDPVVRSDRGPRYLLPETGV